MSGPEQRLVNIWKVGKNISKRELSLFYKTDPFAPLALSLDMWWGRPGGVYGGRGAKHFVTQPLLGM